MDSNDVIVEFQRRRVQAWKSTRWWMLLTVIAGMAFAMGPQGNTLKLTQGQFTYQMVCLLVVFIAFAVVILRVAAVYRCPNCNALPMTRMGGGGAFGYRQGLSLNPAECPKCGAQLRSDG